jgi:Lrp/AsnC family leucine-responsive transcriptional regulator
MKKNELDHIDYEILRMLQEDARMPLKEIAASVFLSSPAVSARIENLVNKGYIQGFHAQINPEVMGYHIKAFINLEVSPKDKKNFYPYIKECRNVVECNCVTGDYSMLLEVLFPSTAELDQFIGELQEYGRTNTLIVFSTSVEHRGVIIDDSREKE